MISTFSEYETAAVSTAIYPGQGGPLGVMYCALKLNGEAGELAEHVGKALRDDCYAQTERVGVYPFSGDVENAPIALTSERRTLIIKEIGDCLWYLAALARELGTSLGAIAAGNIAKLAKRKLEGKLGGSGDNR